jgi:hypothetical protein
MYEYRVKLIGETAELRRRFGPEAGIVSGEMPDELLQAALDLMAERGWRLHTCQILKLRHMLLVFEREKPS